MRRTPRTSALLGLIVSGSMLSSLAADLPVREVILYKNGVGYIERGGALPAGASARLDFQSSEMNDVLKSLTVRDASGGTVNGIRYDSAEPVEKKLAAYPFHLGEGQALSALLDQMKGATVEVQMGSGVVAGVVTGGRELKGANGTDKEQLLLLTGDGVLRTIDLEGVTSLKFTDPELQRQLTEYLAALTASRSQEKKSVYLDSSNDRARTLSVSYLIPAPIWKSTYRLLFDAAGAATLEGWAIVDNMTGEDWTGVRLALVSGRPVSFISQLYSPRYVTRQTVDDQDVVAAVPRRFGGNIGAGSGGVIGGIAGGVPGGVGGGVSESRVMAMETAPSSIPNDIQTREAGELFEYRFGSPVTVKKNESAMLPFLQTKVGARKLLIWTSGVHPMNAAELTNSTGKTLDAGPVTVFDDGSYAGEALVDVVKQGDKRLVGFAIDQGTRIENRVESEREVAQEVRLNRGVLTVRSALKMTTTYTIKNVDAKDKRLIIEHPLRTNTKITSAQPTETTTTARRFEIALKAKSDEKFVVTEEALLTTTHQVSSLTPDALLIYQRGKISDAGRRALEDIAARKQAIAQTGTDLASIDRQLAEIAQDQQRLRENIGSLSNIAAQQDQVQRYAKQLSDQETAIAGLRDRQASLRRQRDSQQADLNAVIEKLSF